MSDPTPSSRKGIRWALIGGLTLVVLLAAAAMLSRLALGELRTRVLTALGPQSEVGEISVTWNAVVIDGLRVNAPAGWPVKQTLVAKRVTIVPALADAVTGRLRINAVIIDGAELSLLRAADGRLRVMPGLTERKAGAGGTPAANTGTNTTSGPTVSIDLIALRNSRIQFIDAAIASPPLQLALQEVNGQLTNLQWPALNSVSGLELAATMAGAKGPGQLRMKGEITFASKDSNLALQLRDMPAVALEPYLVRAAESGVEAGLLNLDFTAQVVDRRINAAGNLVMRELVLKDGDGVAATFMGLPRTTFIDMLRQQDGRIEVPFRVEGSLDDPAFSLQSAFKARLGIAAATALGLSIKSLTEEWKSKGGTKEKVDATVDAFKRLLGR